MIYLGSQELLSLIPESEEEKKKQGLLKCFKILSMFWECLSIISSVQLLSHVRLFATPRITACQPPCRSPTPRVHSNSCPSSWWCHSAILSSVVPFSSCPQSLPESKSFPMSQLFAWSGQSTGVSALALFLPKKSQGWSPSEWTGLELYFLTPFLFCGKKLALYPVSENFLLKLCFTLPTEES